MSFSLKLSIPPTKKKKEKTLAPLFGWPVRLSVSGRPPVWFAFFLSPLSSPSLCASFLEALGLSLPRFRSGEFRLEVSEKLRDRRLEGFLWSGMAVVAFDLVSDLAFGRVLSSSVSSAPPLLLLGLGEIAFSICIVVGIHQTVEVRCFCACSLVSAARVLRSVCLALVWPLRLLRSRFRKVCCGFSVVGAAVSCPSFQVVLAFSNFLVFVLGVWRSFEETRRELFLVKSIFKNRSSGMPKLSGSSSRINCSFVFCGKRFVFFLAKLPSEVITKLTHNLSILYIHMNPILEEPMLLPVLSCGNIWNSKELLIQKDGDFKIQ
ncbi:hypothetical protein F2Q68_00016871 [Brassica cretica]|uniref:Uncharacterized protein n=1 Tax=Brassica cretica TaxID=69181 RepID=A0A8S9H9G8_BRACR|nr:hypothetical protein F2Q68_00016871 [Brassica cretica]